MFYENRYNKIRREQKLTIDDVVTVEYSTEDDLLNSAFKDYADDIKKQVLASELKPGGEKEVEVDGRVLLLGVGK